MNEKLCQIFESELKCHDSSLHDQLVWDSAVLLKSDYKDQELGLADLYQLQLDRQDFAMIKSLM